MSVHWEHVTGCSYCCPRNLFRALANPDHHNGIQQKPERGHFLESFLEPSKRTGMQRSPSATSRGRMHPQTPSQQDTFSNFRSSSPDGYYQAYKREQVIVKKTLGKDEKPPPKNGYNHNAYGILWK